MSAYGYGNFGHYRGESIQDQIAVQRMKLECECRELTWNIQEYMSHEDYCAWVDSLPDCTNYEFTQFQRDKLDQLKHEECTCTDPERTCPACRHAAYHQWYMKQGE